MTVHNPTAHNPKRHHIVPKMLLRNFATSDGYLHAYNKLESRHFKVAPDNVFVQNDRYTQFNVENDDERYEVERHLAEIESQAAPVIKKVVGCRRARLYPPLAEEEGDAVKLLFMTMFLRTDHHADEIVPLDQYEQMFRREFAKQGGIHGLEGDELRGWEEFQRGPDATALIRGELIPDLRARVAVGMPPKIADEVDRYMLESGLLIATLGKQASGFILGDCGGVRVFESDNSDVYRSWLPASREVILGPTTDTQNVTFTNLNRKDVNRINWTTFEASDIVVANRRSDLDYVVRRWEDCQDRTPVYQPVC